MDNRGNTALAASGVFAHNLSSIYLYLIIILTTNTTTITTLIVGNWRIEKVPVLTRLILT